MRLALITKALSILLQARSLKTAIYVTPYLPPFPLNSATFFSSNPKSTYLISPLSLSLTLMKFDMSWQFQDKFYQMQLYQDEDLEKLLVKKFSKPY